MEMKGQETKTSGFELRVEAIDGASVLHVNGEVDLLTHEHLSEELTSLAGKAGPIVVELSECDFIDSSGIRALLVGGRAVADSEGAGGKIVLAGAVPQVSRILEMTGVGEALPIYPGLDEALAALGAPSAD